MPGVVEVKVGEIQSFGIVIGKIVKVGLILVKVRVRVILAMPGPHVPVPGAISEVVLIIIVANVQIVVLVIHEPIILVYITNVPRVKLLSSKLLLGLNSRLSLKHEVIKQVGGSRRC